MASRLMNGSYKLIRVCGWNAERMSNALRFSFQRKQGEEQRKPLTRSIKGIREEERSLERDRTAKAKERKGFSSVIKLMSPKPGRKLRT